MSEPFKIYAAVYCMLLRDGKTYLMRRVNTGYRDGYWSLPAGHVEAGESLRGALVREAREEAGLMIKPEDLIQRHAMFRRSDRTYADYFFTCEAWEGEPTITEPHKCDAAEWFALENLPEKMPTEVRQAYACLASGEAFSEIQTAGRE